MVPVSRKLFRAHSTKHLTGATGEFSNPNLQRARKPRDMPLATHNILNEWFIDRFSVAYREKSLFCTGDALIAAGYVSEASSLILIEPVGDYSVCYSSRCKDLYSIYQFNWSTSNPSALEIRTHMDGLDFVQHHNTGLEEAAATGCEVMLFAESFRYRIC
ncbi:hypothetical protein ACTORR_01060 [Pseudomonas sp. SAR267]|uniref:hypothetical protein n=1 Tax=Pseudomonas sp. SAR267 TaxID=3454502 RepID=UPI003F8E7151